MAYVQAFRYGRPLSEPRVIHPMEPPEDLRLPVNMQVRGFMAEDIARPFGATAVPAEISDIGRRLVRCAEWRMVFQNEQVTAPAPLYVRPADAAPSRDAPPVMLDDA
jgi:hypothetical protein